MFSETIKNVPDSRIFAVLFDAATVTKEEWERMPDEIQGFRTIVDLRDHKDFCTLHQPSESKETWFWESVNHSASTPGSKVLHRPFAWLMPENLKEKTDYNHVMFCVAYAPKSRLLPPAVTYGK